MYTATSSMLRYKKRRYTGNGQPICRRLSSRAQPPGHRDSGTGEKSIGHPPVLTPGSCIYVRSDGDRFGPVQPPPGSNTRRISRMVIEIRLFPASDMPAFCCADQNMCKSSRYVRRLGSLLSSILDACLRPHAPHLKQLLMCIP